MNFNIEPWELPPDADAGRSSVPIEFGPVEWNGGPTMISARTVPTKSRQSLAFFHPHASEINYAVLINDALGTFKEHIDSKKLGRIIRQALEPKHPLWPTFKHLVAIYF